MKEHSTFKWNDIGDLNEGRPNLGQSMPVAIYRLMQYTMKDVLINNFGFEKTVEIFRQSGNLAGREFAINNLDKSLDFNSFISLLQKLFLEYKIGVIRLEKADTDSFQFMLTIAEDLDCSGLPFTDEEVCYYDEGFLSAIMKYYYEKDFNVKEIDCWASGDRVCRFEILPAEIRK